MLWDLDSWMRDWKQLRKLWKQKPLGEKTWGLMHWAAAGIQRSPMAIGVGEQHNSEHSPDAVSQPNLSHCQSATSSERGKIASPGKFLSGHFIRKNKGGWNVDKGILVTVQCLKCCSSSPARSRRKCCVLSVSIELRAYWGLDSPPKTYERSWRKKHTHTHSWLALFSRYWKSDCHLCQISSWHQSWLALPSKTASQWQQKIYHDSTSNWVRLFFQLQPQQAGSAGSE